MYLNKRGLNQMISCNPFQHFDSKMKKWEKWAEQSQIIEIIIFIVTGTSARI